MGHFHSTSYLDLTEKRTEHDFLRTARVTRKDRRWASIKSRATQGAERLSFEGATVTKITYSGFYWTLDLEHNAELQNTVRCSPIPVYGPVIPNALIAEGRY